jgi:hypothetical protein
MNTDIENGYINFIDVPHECRYCHVKQIHSIPTVAHLNTDMVAVEYPVTCHQCKCVKTYSVRVKKII